MSNDRHSKTPFHRGVDRKSFHLSHHACWADTKFQVFDLFVTEFQSVNKIVFHDTFYCALGNVTEYYVKHLLRVQISIWLVMRNPSVSLGFCSLLLYDAIVDRYCRSPGVDDTDYHSPSYNDTESSWGRLVSCLDQVSMQSFLTLGSLGCSVDQWVLLRRSKDVGCHRQWPGLNHT